MILCTEALVIQHATRIRHIVIVPCPHYLINSTIFGKQLLKKMCVLIFIYNFFSATFLILRRNERDMKKIYIGLHIKYLLFLSGFSELEFA